MSSTFEWNPEAVEHIERMVVQNMEEPARRAVEATVCQNTAGVRGLFVGQVDCA